MSCFSGEFTTSADFQPLTDSASVASNNSLHCGYREALMDLPWLNVLQPSGPSVDEIQRDADGMLILGPSPVETAQL